MVNTEDPSFTKLSKVEKTKVLDDCIKRADNKLSDIQFFVDLVSNYKTKIELEKAKI